MPAHPKPKPDRRRVSLIGQLPPILMTPVITQVTIDHVFLRFIRPQKTDLPGVWTGDPAPCYVTGDFLLYATDSLAYVTSYQWAFDADGEVLDCTMSASVAGETAFAFWDWKNNVRGKNGEWPSCGAAVFGVL